MIQSAFVFYSPCSAHEYTRYDTFFLALNDANTLIVAIPSQVVGSFPKPEPKGSLKKNDSTISVLFKNTGQPGSRTCFIVSHR